MDEIIETRECQELLDYVTPDLYRRNLHRVLGLTIGETPADVRRRQKRLKIQDKFGMRVAGRDGDNLILRSQATEEETRAALEKLNDPKARFLDEIFWFWPLNGKDTDEALEALKEGRTENALKLWDQRAKRGDKTAQIAIHNRAVFHHLMVLDHEQKTANTSQNIVKNPADEQWLLVFEGWWEVWEGDVFWTLLRNHVREINDLQLTTGFVSRIQNSLPKALLLINAQLARDAAQNGNANRAKQHIAIVQNSATSPELSEEVLQEALRPMRNHLKAAVDSVRSRWRSTPQHGGRYVRELHDQTKQILAAVDMLLSADSPVRMGLHDLVADAMLDGQIAFGSKTNDWAESISLLEMAQQVALGDTVLTRIKENLGFVKDNLESANDWCSPDYWELPEETLAVLEAAREKSRAGNLDGAIEDLAVLDPKIGIPLRRALAYCLSLKGIRIFNDAMTEYNKETDTLSKLLGKLRGMETTAMQLLLMRRPDPQSPSYLNPACPCCGSSYYTRWTTLTYKEIPLFMCGSCGDNHRSEIERQKATFRVHIKTTLEHLLLAVELDPKDPGVQRNLTTIKKTAGDFGCPIPKADALKEQLKRSRIRGKLEVLTRVTEDAICYFCDLREADSSCRIAVPMCGDQERVKLIFGGEGIEYRYGEVIVPRCPVCRAEHEQHPLRIESWYEGRAAASDESHFPEIAETVRAAEDSVRAAEEEESKARDPGRFPALASEESEAGRAVKTAQSRIDELQGSLKAAQAKLEKASQRYTVNPIIVVGGLMAMFLASVVTFDKLSLSPAFFLIPIAAVVGFFVFMKRMKRKSRRYVEAQSTAEKVRGEIAEAEEGSRAAAVTLEAIRERLRAAQDASEMKAKEVTKERREVQAKARERLHSAQTETVLAYERDVPRPAMAPGIKPEDAFVDFDGITALRKRKWSFGKTPAQDGRSGLEQPVDAGGLIGRVPRIPEETAPTSAAEPAKRAETKTPETTTYPVPGTVEPSSHMTCAKCGGRTFDYDKFWKEYVCRNCGWQTKGKR